MADQIKLAMEPNRMVRVREEVKEGEGEKHLACVRWLEFICSTMHINIDWFNFRV